MITGMLVRSTSRIIRRRKGPIVPVGVVEEDLVEPERLLARCNAVMK
jgi:hypothetical protein